MRDHRDDGCQPQLVVLILAVAALIAALLTGCDPEPASTPPAQTPAPVQEDEPGWDCRSDGNRRCGPTVGAQ